MTSSPPPHSDSRWSNRDLRHRSFRGRDLTNADFSGSDIRGCDFSKAQLRHADFRRVKAGLTRRQIGLQVALALGVGLWIGHVVSLLVISSLGQTTADRAWRFVAVLYVVLGLCGLSNALQSGAVRFGAASKADGSGAKPINQSRFQLVLKRTLKRSLEILTNALPAALVGFFYAGTFSANSSTIATAGAAVGGAIGVIASIVVGRQTRWRIVIASAGAVCAYGFTFWLGAIAIALLSVQQYLWGIPASILTLFCLWLTWRCFCLILYRIRQTIGTSFRGADLTQAQFDPIELPQTDFSKAIGYESRL